MELTQTIKWNKLTTRELDEDEKELYGHIYDYMWDGPTPEDGQEVLVYVPNNYYGKYNAVFTDIWTDYQDGIGFEQTFIKNGETVYWAAFPEPPKLDYDGEYKFQDCEH